MAIVSPNLAAVARSGSAADLGTGTLPSGRLSGSYSGVTALGTLTSLVASGVLQTSADTSANYSMRVDTQTAITVANSANAALNSGSGVGGFLVIIDPTITGDIAIYLLVAGLTSKMVFSNQGVFIDCTSSPGAGKISVNWDGGTSKFRIYNNQGNSINFKMYWLRLL